MVAATKSLGGAFLLFVTPGLFGRCCRYPFFGEFVNTILLQLPVTQADTLIRVTVRIHPRDASKLVIAASAPTSPKLVLLNINTGELVVRCSAHAQSDL